MIIHVIQQSNKPHGRSRDLKNEDQWCLEKKCYFHVGKNVRAKIITDCRVKPKIVVVDGKKKLVDQVKPSEIVDNIFHAWEKVVESPTQELYASNVMEFQDACKIFPKFPHYVQTIILDTLCYILGAGQRTKLKGLMVE